MMSIIFAKKFDRKLCGRIGGLLNQFLLRVQKIEKPSSSFLPGLVFEKRDKTNELFLVKKIRSSINTGVIFGTFWSLSEPFLADEQPIIDLFGVGRVRLLEDVEQGPVVDRPREEHELHGGCPQVVRHPPSRRPPAPTL
jgi:hypothetical protein